MHPFLFSQMTPLYIILPNVLFTCTRYFLKIFPRYTTGQKFEILTSILVKLPLWQYLTRGISTPFIFQSDNNIHLSETDTHKHLGLIFHHSLSWHTHFLHLHQKVMTKTNRLRSFSNSLPRHSLLATYKTNILLIFDYGSIIYDNCSDSDEHLLDKVQLSATKIIFGCLKNTSSSDVLLV